MISFKVLFISLVEMKAESTIEPKTCKGRENRDRLLVKPVISRRYQSRVLTFFGLTTSLTKSVESLIRAFLIATEQNACQKIILGHACILNGHSIRIFLLLVVNHFLFLIFFFRLLFFVFFS